jgi:hypothetical protein
MGSYSTRLRDVAKLCAACLANADFEPGRDHGQSYKLIGYGHCRLIGLSEIIDNKALACSIIRRIALAGKGFSHFDFPSPQPSPAGEGAL